MDSPHTRLSDRRIAYAADHPVVIALSTGGVLVAMQAIASPHLADSTSVGRVLPLGLAILWFVMHGVGALGFLYGIFRLNPKIEGAGCFLLAATFLVTVVCSIDLLGFDAARLGATWLTFVALGFSIRGRVLFRRYALGREGDGWIP